MRCENCTHKREIHVDESGACRLTGCGCDLFIGWPKGYGGPSGRLNDPDDGGRQICIDVPDGYMVSVSLVPYAGHVNDGEPDDEPETASGAVTVEAVPGEDAA